MRRRKPPHVVISNSGKRCTTKSRWNHPLKYLPFERAFNEEIPGLTGIEVSRSWTLAPNHIRKYGYAFRQICGNRSRQIRGGCGL